MSDTAELVSQALRAFGYYAVILLLARVAGKRLAGQMTTFDLIVLIALASAAQGIMLDGGPVHAIVFIVVVLVTHRGVAFACSRSATARLFLRGAPRALVRDGKTIRSAMREESVSEDELLAGLRKLGFEGVEGVKLAVLEETGHISAVPADSHSRAD